MGATPLDILTSAGFSKERPTLFCSEAALFYVDDLPKRRLFQDLLLASTTSPDSAVVLTDNLKPLLPSPFTHEARAFFEDSNFDLLKHSARWGGAVHYAFAARRDSQIYDQLVVDRQDTTVLYLPILSHGAAALQKQPTFENAWYAVAFSKQLERQDGDDFDELGYTPYATRLFGSRWFYTETRRARSTPSPTRARIDRRRCPWGGLVMTGICGASTTAGPSAKMVLERMWTSSSRM